jgi:eukaryotic-like serine/threonine-protein kinase
VTPTSVMLAERYRLESRIAFGGVGEVWRATDLVLGRPVAVKMLRDGYTDHPETLARFRAEARHAGSLIHPGIAKVYDYGEADPPHSPYLVMELVDGPSLAGLLKSGPLPPDRTMDIVAQAAAGLAAAHAAGLVHRDIKPANLLLTPGGAVKITDFGLARAVDSTPLTMTGALVGTPAYLAPERATGASATPATDLYSLGVVAYECLTGRPPFDGSPLEMVAAHQRRPLPLLPVAVPAEVAALVTGLTAKNPADRPASAADVAARAARLAAAPVPPVAAASPVGAAPTTEQATLAGAPLPVPPRGASAWRDRLAARRTAVTGRAATLALAATAAAAGLAIAGLTGWLLAGGGSQAPAHHPAAVRSPASSPSHRAHHPHPPPAGRHGGPAPGKGGPGKGGPGPGDGGPGPGNGHGNGDGNGGGDGNGQGDGG